MTIRPSIVDQNDVARHQYTSRFELSQRSRTAYEAYGTGVFLVRPHGYIGWAGETVVGLEWYAGRFRSMLHASS